MSSGDDDERYEAEIKELKENAKNLTDCLQTLKLRIEDLEARRSRHQAESSPVEANGIDEHQQERPGNGKKEVRVERTETTSPDGSTVTKKIHVTERVVTTKTYQTNYEDADLYRLSNFQLGAPILDDSSDSTPRNRCAKNEVRLIGLKKPKGDNHLGLTVTPENGQLVVGRILHDSPLQGLIHAGDCILEVNGVEVKNPEDLQEQIRKSSEGLSLKTIPSGLEDSPSFDGTFVKAFVDYEPGKDDKIPCKEIGLPFKAGDILQIISKEDPNWWQARNVRDWSTTGLIPSQSLEENRRANTGANDTLGGLVTVHRRRKIMYKTKDNANYDKSDLLIYDEVGRLSPYGRRVLVILGAPGVGRRTLKTMLLQHDPRSFASATPYTSRETRPGEQEGREYHFVSREALQKEIDQGQMVEFGELNGVLYGTGVESIRRITKTGRICLLDCSVHAIKFLYTWEFMPFIVFVAPPQLEELKQLYKVHPNRTKPKTNEDLKQTCEMSAQLESQYGPLFDLHLVNRNVDVTFRRILDALEGLKTDTQWVPISWLYG